MSIETGEDFIDYILKTRTVFYHIRYNAVSLNVSGMKSIVRIDKKLFLINNFARRKIH